MTGSPFLTPVMTLPEYLKGQDIDDNARPLVEMFAKSSDIMEAIPFAGLTGAVYQGYRQASLATGMAFRAINAPSTSGAGVVTPYQESTYVVDHDIPIDRAIVRRGGERRRAWEEQMGMARLGELWVTEFLKGDNSSDNTVFNGVQKRAAKYGRTIDNSGGTVGGSALSLTQLDWAIQNTRKATHIIAPWATRRYFTQAARNSTLTGFLMKTEWNQVGSPIMSYAGLPILWGYEKDLHPPILPFTEVAPAGGAAQTSSIYVVSLAEDGLHGIQLAPMEIRDMGLLQDGVTYNTHISWDVGLVDDHQFCLTRLCGITLASIVA